MNDIANNIDVFLDKNIRKRFSEIQANILIPHGCDNVACLFVTLNKKTNGFRNWIGKFSKNITNANSLPRNKNKKIKFRKKYVTVNLHLSHTAFEKLEIELSSYFDSFFRYGMKNNGDTILNDKNELKWESRYQNDLDILITFGCDCKEKLMLTVFSVYQELDKLKSEISHKFIEFGAWKYGSFSDGKHRIEPFGYRDGISKVHFFENDGKDLIKDRWKIVLDDFGGSYLVFRKFEQNVCFFNKQVKELANALKIPIDYAEAQIIGRFKNGKPLVLSNNSQPTVHTFDRLKEKKFDNYDVNRDKQSDFSDDLIGAKCPFHAHIRKANPRQKELLNHGPYKPGNIPSRIVRRGIPYANNDKEGMLFMCFQQNLKNHFVRIHNEWMNNEIFPTDSRIVGIDPLSNKEFNSEDENENPKQHWNHKWGDQLRRKSLFRFKNVVDFVGGEYFYTPNIPFLESLSS